MDRIVGSLSRLKRPSSSSRFSGSFDCSVGCNDRCDQENLIAQLSGGVRSLCAPVDNLHSNWAYMLMTSVACKANDSSLDELERLHTGLLSTLQGSEPLTAGC